MVRARCGKPARPHRVLRALPRGHRLPRADREPAARPRHDLPLPAAARASAGGTVRRGAQAVRRGGSVATRVVALDGTTLPANASRERNRTDAELAAEVRRILAEAERVDAEERASATRGATSCLRGSGTARSGCSGCARRGSDWRPVNVRAGGLRGTPQEPRGEGPARAPPAAAAARPGCEGERHRPGQPRGARLSRLLSGRQRAGGDESRADHRRGRGDTCGDGHARTATDDRGDAPQPAGRTLRAAARAAGRCRLLLRGERAAGRRQRSGVAARDPQRPQPARRRSAG